jgi:ribosome modulation factor
VSEPLLARTLREATPAGAAQRRQELRQLEQWRAWLPGWRDAVATAADEATLADDALGRVVGERARLGQLVARTMRETGAGFDYGRGSSPAGAAEGPVLQGLVTQLEVAGGEEQERLRQQSAAAGRLVWLRRRLADLERQVRERAEALGVALEPGEAEPPPAPPPLPPSPYTLWTPPPAPEPDPPAPDRREPSLRERLRAVGERLG